MELDPVENRDRFTRRTLIRVPSLNNGCMPISARNKLRGKIKD